VTAAFLRPSVEFNVDGNREVGLKRVVLWLERSAIGVSALGVRL